MGIEIKSTMEDKTNTYYQHQVSATEMEGVSKMSITGMCRLLKAEQQETSYRTEITTHIIPYSRKYIKYKMQQ